MRIAARGLGLLFLLAAVLALGADLGAAGDGGGTTLRPLGALWYSLHPASLNLVQAVIERYVWEPLWDPVMIAVLQWPAAVTLAVPGAILIGVSFLRRPAREDTAGNGKSAEPSAGGRPRS